MKNKTKENLKQIFIFILTLINFILPIFICLLWFKPIIEHFNENHLLKLKIFSISFCILLRICLFKPYIQIYLDTAFDRVKILYDQQQLTTTRITNLSYQRNVRSIFLYLGVVVCQYILPAFIQLIICFYLKIFSDNKSNLTMNSSPPKWLQNFDNYMMNTTNTNSSLILTWNDMKTLFNNQHIAVFISYLLFWHHAIFCLISCGSLIYNTYIQREQHIKND